MSQESPQMPAIDNLRRSVLWTTDWLNGEKSHLLIRELAYYVFALEQRVRALESGGQDGQE